MGLQLVADGLGGDASEGHGGLELRIGLALGVDEAVDVLLDLGAEFFGGFASAEVVGVEAADAAAKFVQTGVDGGASPAESGLGAACRAIAVFEGDLSLEAPASMAREQFRG